MREEVCTFGGSYDNNVLWYDDDENRFYIDQYHFGVIDDEEHFDGTVQIDTLTALEKMIKKNKLRSVLMYRDKLNLFRDLDVVLAGLRQTGTVYDYGFLADKRYKYYEITKDEYAVYYEGTFFSVKNGGRGVVDFSVVRRILENYRSVTYYEYGYKAEKWGGSDLMDVSWL